MLGEVQRYIDRLKQTQKREIIDFNSGWLFSDQVSQDASGVQYDDTAWKTVTVPHDNSALQGFDRTAPSGLAGGYVKTGIVWYRKYFDGSGMENKLVKIHFDGVAANSKVFINGHFLGQYPSPFSPFHYDITPYLQFDTPNVIAVMCDTSLQPYSRFYIGTGIYRQVFLTVTDSFHILPNGVHYSVRQTDEKQVEIKVETALSVNAFEDTVWTPFGVPEHPNVDSVQECRLVTNVLDAQGNITTSHTECFSMANYSQKCINQMLTLLSPTMWSPEEPYLYQIQTLLYVNNKLYDDVLTPLGIRILGWDCERGFFLNHQPYKLKGACIHQDISPYGSATTVEAWVRRIWLLKEMGCNSIRTSHYPFPSVFYHICDYMGMTVMDEAFDEWHKGWRRELEPHGKNEYGYFLYFDQWYETDLTQMIKRDRIHPSVIMWSFGNEIPELYFEDSIPILTKMQHIAKSLDDTRPTIVAAEGNYNIKYNPEAMAIPDIAGFNYVDIRYGDRQYDTIHAEHPEYVLCGSETSIYPDAWLPVRDNTFVIGQYLWAAFDYLGEAVDFSQIPPCGSTLSEEFMNQMQQQNAAEQLLLHGWPNCIINCVSDPKPDYYLRKCLWSDQPTVKLAVGVAQWQKTCQWNTLPAKSHWNWKEGKSVPIYCIHNCEKIVLTLNGEVIHTASNGNECVFPQPIQVPFHAGILELIGYCGGREVCHDRLITAEEPQDIRAIVNEEALRTGELVELQIEIVDQNGVHVPITEESLTLTVGGCGEFYAMATGNLYDSTPYFSNVFVPYEGRCLALIRTKAAGDIEIELTYQNLYKKYVFRCSET